VKRNYYYLVSGLQDLFPGIHKLVLDQAGFRDLLKEHLHPADYRLAERLYLPYDNKNLLQLLQQQNAPFDERGINSADFLTEQLREPEGLPEYMAAFISAFRAQEPLFPGMSPENELTTLYYKEMLDGPDDFLNGWFRFSLNVKNLLTASIARQQEIPYEHQIIGDDEISTAIRKSHLRDFGLSSELDYLEQVTEIAAMDDFIEREKAIDQMIWDYLDEHTFFEYFTIDRILAYVIRLDMVSRWMAIDTDRGIQLFKEALQALKGEYQLPRLFTDKK
jgi:hypothetical protein